MINLSDQSSGALTFLLTEIEGSTKPWETVAPDVGGHGNRRRSIFEGHAGGEQ